MPPTWRSLPYAEDISELIARHLRHYNFTLAHKPTQSLQNTFVRVKDRLPAQKQRNVVYNTPCSECLSSYVGQCGRQFGTHMKEHKGAARRQDENSLLALHCLTTSHAFDWDRANASLWKPGIKPPHASTRACTLAQATLRLCANTGGDKRGKRTTTLPFFTNVAELGTYVLNSAQWTLRYHF